MLRCFFHSKSGRSSWCNLQPQVMVPRLLMVSGSCTCRRKAVTNHCRVLQAAHFLCDTAYRTGLALWPVLGRRSELLSGTLGAPGSPFTGQLPPAGLWLLLHPPAALRHQFSQSVQSLSRVRLFATPWIAARQASLSITNSRSLSKLVHRVVDAIQPSHPLASPSPPAPSPSHHQSLFQWVNSSHEVAKVLEFQLQHHSLQRNPRADLLQNGL